MTFEELLAELNGMLGLRIAVTTAWDTTPWMTFSGHLSHGEELTESESEGVRFLFHVEPDAAFAVEAEDFIGAAYENDRRTTLCIQMVKGDLELEVERGDVEQPTADA